ncbi:MAG: hypothetical protein H6565_11995 [Lewinellaceae bacterium]|nr:hypothetical protein [Lewinellaceae bacterium]
MVPALFITALFAFIAGAIWLKKRRDRQRNVDFERLAKSLGLSYAEKDRYGLLSQLRQFDLFRHYSGRRRWSRNGKIFNVLRGQVGGTEVFMFDYSYIVSTGKSAHEVRQTVFFANNKNWYLPKFRLRPETWWHKVLSRIGAKRDINFDESPDFSDKYWLTGELEDLIRNQFDSDVQALLTERPPLHVEGDNYYLIAYKPRKALNDDEARVFYEHCVKLTRLMQQKEAPELLKLAELKREEAPEPLEAPKLPEKKKS